MKTLRNSALLLVLLASLLAGAACVGSISNDPQKKSVTISTDDGNLELRLNYDGKCLLDRVTVHGRNLVPESTGVCTAIKLGNQWHTTRNSLPPVRVTIGPNGVAIQDIVFGGPDLRIKERWELSSYRDRIVWRITRTYPRRATVEDTYLPGWDFAGMSTWTGALLGHGGVAWCKLFDSPNATYGVHNGEVVFWHKDSGAALRIVPQVVTPSHQVGVRFSRQPSGVFSFNYSITREALAPKHHLSRFLRDRQDVWAPFEAEPGEVTVEYTLMPLDYEKAFDLGDLKSLDVSAVREIRHTIARIGAVDERLHGSNGFYSDCAVLHEPWIAQLGWFINDPAYNRGLADTLDFQRQHAIEANGRVKSRWAGTAGDAMPGSYDACGYYEAQWGYLMDSQPSWVINVAELFDLTADRAWLERQKSACERVLDFMLARDSDGDGLVEMITDSQKQARGSDWLDVIWASYENALVNAQMYQALKFWSDLEDLLADKAKAAGYRAAAQKLKQRFNQTTAEGGFWDAQHQCYAYWRDKDDSVHGTNLVIPVQFSALGYGLCDDPVRRAVILDRIESLMSREQLFFWPLCFFPYAPGEAHPSQYPFPTYENGDLFLAWGELGTRAYAAYQPAVALRYVKNVLARYNQDGLAFQRYLRKTQKGTGNDILANNCSVVVGLYRNIYGLRPFYNRLFLEPHLVPDLDGTRLHYELRGQEYTIHLSTAACSMAVDDFTVSDPKPFGLQVEGGTAQYFFGTNSQVAMRITRSVRGPVDLRIRAWSGDSREPRRWIESCIQPGIELRYLVAGLRPGARYRLHENDGRFATLTADLSGRVEFRQQSEPTASKELELAPE